jgi:hypothetical protein
VTHVTDGRTTDERRTRRPLSAGQTLSLALAALALALTIGGRIAAAADETVENQTVPVNGAGRAAVELDMDFGDLTVQSAAPGTGNLIEATFAFDDDEWRPTVERSDDGEAAVVKIGQPGDAGDLDLNDLDDVLQNEGNGWEIALTPDVPIDLTVDLESGSAALDLDGLTLSGLDVNAEVGEVTVDLSQVVLTEDVDLAIELEGGQVEVVVPAGVGVRIDADTTAGDVDADGFERDGSAYVNAAYGESAVTIRLNVDVTAGEIDLRVAE